MTLRPPTPLCPPPSPGRYGPGIHEFGWRAIGWRAYAYRTAEGREKLIRDIQEASMSDDFELPSEPASQSLGSASTDSSTSLGRVERLADIRCRIREESGRDQELDADIAEACGLRVNREHWSRYTQEWAPYVYDWMGCNKHPLPAFTGDAHQALLLFTRVLPGWGFTRATMQPTFREGDLPRFSITLCGPYVAMDATGEHPVSFPRAILDALHSALIASALSTPPCGQPQKSGEEAGRALRDGLSCSAPSPQAVSAASGFDPSRSREVNNE